MNTPAFDPDDPRLTAYALGESSPAEREAVEQLLAASPEARAEVERTVALARDLEADYRRENEAYWDARHVELPAEKIVAFPNGRRARWTPTTALAWKIAAVLAVLGALAPLALRRALLVQTASLASPPPAATKPPPLAAAPPPAEATPAASTVAQASVPADTDLARPPAAAPEPDTAAATPNTEALLAMDADRTRRDEIPSTRAASRPAEPTQGGSSDAPKPAARPAMTAAAAPGASAADATATMTGGGSVSAVNQIGQSLVSIRTGDGSYVGGVAVMADGWILAAEPLPLGPTPTVVPADRHEFPASLAWDQTGLCWLRAAGALLPGVALASTTPADKDALTVVAMDRHTGTTQFLRAHVATTGAEARVQWDDSPPTQAETSFAFNHNGKLLAMTTASPAEKASDPARPPADAANYAGTLVRPFTMAERAWLQPSAKKSSR